LPRSLKKGPFVDAKLQKRILAMNENNDRKLFKTWSRRSTVTPEFDRNDLAAQWKEVYPGLYYR
jgi:small subunit ribosomal protein S19